VLSLFHEVSGNYEYHAFWLGREFKTEDKSYLAELYGRLNAVSLDVRDRLVPRGVMWSHICRGTDYKI